MPLCAFDERPGSIGGATVAENAYYVNGLNVTNFRTFLGGNTPPIEFYQSFAVQTYGLPAEFGRVLGGAVTAVTKSGSNRFKAGALVSYAPDRLRALAREPEAVAALLEARASEAAGEPRMIAELQALRGLLALPPRQLEALGCMLVQRLVLLA